MARIDRLSLAAETARNFLDRDYIQEITIEMRADFDNMIKNLDDAQQGQNVRNLESALLESQQRFLDLLRLPKITIRGPGKTETEVEDGTVWMKQGINELMQYIDKALSERDL